MSPFILFSYLRTSVYLKNLGFTGKYTTAIIINISNIIYYNCDHGLFRKKLKVKEEMYVEVATPKHIYRHVMLIFNISTELRGIIYKTSN